MPSRPCGGGGIDRGHAFASLQVLVRAAIGFPAPILPPSSQPPPPPPRLANVSSSEAMTARSRSPLPPPHTSYAHKSALGDNAALHPITHSHRDDQHGERSMRYAPPPSTAPLAHSNAATVPDDTTRCNATQHPLHSS
ncbi:hypothetical protein K523DRAFT_358628 [Schizophyllum commune Tattone D]|nr:hypothetical protein K523DRAFT_358628 [Schizophyllum commune Tattone D]